MVTAGGCELDLQTVRSHPPMPQKPGAPDPDVPVGAAAQVLAACSRWLYSGASK
jgi:hypothetical protein